MRILVHTIVAIAFAVMSFTAVSALLEAPHCDPRPIPMATISMLLGPEL